MQMWLSPFSVSANEKRAFLLYYSLPLLFERLEEQSLLHLAFLVGGVYRLLKDSIPEADLQEAGVFLRLYCAQAPYFYGECSDCLHLVIFYGGVQDYVWSWWYIAIHILGGCMHMYLYKLTCVIINDFVNYNSVISLWNGGYNAVNCNYFSYFVFFVSDSLPYQRNNGKMKIKWDNYNTYKR